KTRENKGFLFPEWTTASVAQFVSLGKSLAGAIGIFGTNESIFMLKKALTAFPTGIDGVGGPLGAVDGEMQNGVHRFGERGFDGRFFLGVEAAQYPRYHIGRIRRSPHSHAQTVEVLSSQSAGNGFEAVVPGRAAAPLQLQAAGS